MLITNKIITWFDYFRVCLVYTQPILEVSKQANRTSSFIANIEKSTKSSTLCRSSIKWQRWHIHSDVMKSTAGTKSNKKKRTKNLTQWIGSNCKWNYCEDAIYKYMYYYTIWKYNKSRYNIREKPAAILLIGSIFWDFICGTYWFYISILPISIL